jgi:hypothetical protein
MATPTYELIERVTLGSSSNSVEFTSIPQTFGHLELRMANVSDTASSSQVQVRVNSDTGSNYNSVSFIGTDTYDDGDNRTASYFQTVFVGGFLGTTAEAIMLFQFFDYAETDRFKPVLYRLSSLGDKYQSQNFGYWANTTAISSIQCTMSDFASGTVFSLYGIAS